MQIQNIKIQNLHLFIIKNGKQIFFEYFRTDFRQLIFNFSENE